MPTVQSGEQDAKGFCSVEKRPINVLSLEGGGARGVIELTFLSELEKETGLSVHEIFHLIGGSSAGGVIAAALTLPKDTSVEKSQWVPRFSAAELLKEFEAQLPNLFQSRFSLWGLLGPRYKNIGPREVAETFFGRTTFDQSLTRVMVPAFDLNTDETIIFKSWKSHRNCFHTTDIVIGTGSAPTYFEPHVMKSIPKNGIPEVRYRLVDGGVSDNDPTQSVIIEAEKLFGRDQDHQILSLGTGDVAKSYPYKKYKDGGVLTWVLAIKDLFLDGQRSLTNYSMKHQYGSRYSHWSPAITIANHRIDNYAPEALQYYKQATLEMIERKRDEFDHLVDRLLKNLKHLH